MMKKKFDSIDKAIKKIRNGEVYINEPKLDGSQRERRDR